MENVKIYLRGYLILLLLLRVAAFLFPKERDQMFFRKIVGIWMTILLLTPALLAMKTPNFQTFFDQLELVETNMEQHFNGEEYVGGEENIFEFFAGNENSSIP